MIPLLFALQLDPLNLEQDELVVLALHDARVLSQRGRVVSAIGRLALLLLVLRARLVRRDEERRQGRGELVDLLRFGLSRVWVLSVSLPCLYVDPAHLLCATK